MIKRGKPYQVLGIVKDATNGREKDRLMLYKSLSGHLYVRMSKEFREKFTMTKYKRFTEISFNDKYGKR